MFKISGAIGGVPVTIAWADGQITSDKAGALFVALTEFRRLNGTRIGQRTRDHVKDALSAFIILTTHVFDLGGQIHSGNVPLAPVDGVH